MSFHNTICRTSGHASKFGLDLLIEVVHADLHSSHPCMDCLCISVGFFLTPMHVANALADAFVTIHQCLERQLVDHGAGGDGVEVMVVMVGWSWWWW